MSVHTEYQFHMAIIMYNNNNIYDSSNYNVKFNTMFNMCLVASHINIS